MNSHTKLRSINVDGKIYKYLLACHKCGEIRRRRVIVEMSLGNYERMISYDPVTVTMVKEFIRGKVDEKSI